MATRKNLFLTPSFGNVAGPTAGGAYQDMPTSALAAMAPTPITSPGQGNMALPSPPASSASSSNSSLEDLAKFAATLGGGALAANALSKLPTSGAVDKIGSAISDLLKPKTPATPTSPSGAKPGGVIGGAPNGTTGGTTGGIDVNGNVKYPTDPTGGTPYDDDGNLMPGWQLNENNDPVWVGVQATTGGLGQVSAPTQPLAPATPATPTVPTAPITNTTPPATTPTTPTGGLNAVAPKSPTPPSAPVSASPIPLPKTGGTTPSEPVEEPVVEEPVDEAVDENGFVSYAEDEAGNIWGISADGEQVLFMPVNSVGDTTYPDYTDTSGVDTLLPEEPTPEEPVYAQDEAGNIFELVDGEWVLAQEAAGSYPDYTDYTDPVVDYEDPVFDYTDPFADYVDPYADYVMQEEYTGEPDYYGVKNGGLMQARKYAGGGIAHMASGGIPDGAISDGEGGFIVEGADGSPIYLDANGNEVTPTNQMATVYNSSGTSYVPYDSTGVYAAQNDPSILSAANSTLGEIGSWLKANPVAGGTTAALLMQLLSKAGGTSSTNYKPDMAAAGVKPHTTDFGLGPARTVTSGNQTPYYSQDQAKQLNTYLGVPGFDIQRQDPNAEPNVFTPAAAPQGGLASAAKPMADGGIAAASQHYSYGKPVDPMEVLGIRQPPMAMEPQTQAVAHGGSMHPKGPLGVPIAQGRHDYRQGAAVNGPGDGQSDDIPAMLADGEYVIDAELVSMLGNGSNKAGAKVLDQFRQNVRAHKRSAPLGKIPPKSKSPLEYMKGTKNG